ncbi:MAG: cupin-like domain-containing protein [Pseudomonadota bacterium]
MRIPAGSTPVTGAPSHSPAASGAQHQAARRPAAVPDFDGNLFPRSLAVHSVAKEGLNGIRQHIARRKPMLITDLASTWPALARWQPEALGARYGDNRVRVYDASFGTPGKGYMGAVDEMTFGHFLNDVLREGRDLRMFLYNIGRQIPELLDDISFPDLGLKFSRRFVFTFIGCQGSTTPLHYDIDMGHVLHTVVSGRRRVRLFAPDDAVALYQHPFTVRSYVDLDAPSLDTHPALACARGWECVVEAGQTLFMPAGFWHEFHYLDAGIGLSLRASSDSLSDKLQGIGNLFVRSPVDRLANKMAPDTWFDWKQRRARQRGQALLERMRSA